MRPPDQRNLDWSGGRPDQIYDTHLLA